MLLPSWQLGTTCHSRLKPHRSKGEWNSPPAPSIPRTYSQIGCPLALRCFGGTTRSARHTSSSLALQKQTPRNFATQLSAPLAKMGPAQIDTRVLGKLFGIDVDNPVPPPYRTMVDHAAELAPAGLSRTRWRCCWTLTTVSRKRGSEWRDWLSSLICPQAADHLITGKGHCAWSRTFYRQFGKERVLGQ